MKMIIKGGAQSGKDTVGEMFAKKRKGVCIAQADPMKRFALKVFGFSQETLWGPSQLRNALVRESEPDMELWWRTALHNFHQSGHTLLHEVVPNARHPEAWNELRTWFNNLWSTFRDDVSARVMLQTVGTEWGRIIDPDMWNRWALKTADKLAIGGHTYSRVDGLVADSSITGADAPNLVVITDGRFRNEVAGTRAAGGLAVQVIDPNAPETGPGIKGHRSEEEMKSIPMWWFHMTIYNDKTRGLELLDQMVEVASTMLFPERVCRFVPGDGAVEKPSVLC